MRRIWLAVALMIASAVGPSESRGGDPSSPSLPGELTLRHCGLSFEKTTMLGTNHNIGLIQECLVEPGDRVVTGQLLARLFNKDVIADLKAREVGVSNNQTQIRQAELALELERAILARDETLFNKKAYSAQNLQIQRITTQTAELNVVAAKQNLAVAEAAYEQAKAAALARDVIAPHDGVITEVYKRVGEGLSGGQALHAQEGGEAGISNFVLFKLVNLDRMRVDARVDAPDAWRVHPGCPIRITAELEGSTLPIESEVFVGKVTFVDSEIDPQTRTCRVHAEVTNRDHLLRSGLECRMEIGLTGGRGAAAGARPPVAAPPKLPSAPVAPKVAAQEARP